MESLQQGENGAQEAVSVLFGPQGTVTSESLLALRSLLHDNSNLSFLSETISELPSLWSVILDVCPDLNVIPAMQRLTELCSFFTGGSTLTFGPADNILLCPLTVIAQIAEFWKLTHGIDVQSPLSSELRDVQGFCLGFLTAVAVSGSNNEIQFRTLASKAVRLAMCMGAIADADALGDGDSASALAVRWKSDAHLQHLQKVLKLHPGAYISVVVNSRTATVTIPKRDSASFASELSKSNIPVMPLVPRGRWHHQAYEKRVQAVSGLCERDARFRFPDASTLNNTLLSNSDGKILKQGPLHGIALRSILSEQARWDMMFDSLSKEKGARNVNFRYISIGEKVLVPHAINSTVATELPHMSGNIGLSSPLTPPLANGLTSGGIDSLPDDAVAVIGMACRYPDADSVEEFWDLISEGRCVIREFPEERYKPSELSKEPRGPFYGGYVRNSDMFDHRFFGISGREAKSMDPQQRMCLQVAYEAMESAGFYGLRSDQFDKEVGCYLGSANDDYFDNVHSHPLSAFSLTGTLRSFISGRVSHCFGWTGPSMVLDTACSAAAVAIHTACKALQTKDCSVAVAGGVCSMSSSRMTQNLISAGFLSPTGPSKAFDASADGYCRAEGTGIVVLRSLKEATRRGDHILGIITGTAVNQGGNHSAIFVPDGQSQHELYEKVLARSGTTAEDVSYVESHGTGTQVGDPIEFKSIRDTFGGSQRKEDVYVGSVKDNIGHTEASSGVASLIKTILMMQNRTIPKQANFTRLNPKIQPLGPDRVLIPTQSRKWNTTKRIALINNYGAGGNNAAMVLQEQTTASATSHSQSRGQLDYAPIYISGKTTEAIRSYCKRLETFLTKNKTVTLTDVAYNLAIKQNREFENSLTLMSTSVKDLVHQLARAASGTTELQSTLGERPLIVLCFGGQDGKWAHISKDLYDSSILLQRRLLECDLVCTEDLSLPSLFPTIFNLQPIDDIVALHCALFSIQYACAQSWLDSGLKVDKLIGHSFGQLTALCLAGSLSLFDALRLVSERARLVAAYCSTEPGIMLAIEGSEADRERLIRLTEQQYPRYSGDVACNNGPRSFVIAGGEASIKAVEKAAESFPGAFRMMRLENSHAFHSRLLDEILPELLQTARELRLSTPKITIEACSDDDWSNITAEKIVRHTRGTVQFMQAVRRIEEQASRPVVWLEAGSGSPIIPLVKRAVCSGHEHVYIPTPLRASDAQANITKAICRLWAKGVRAQFWLFHQSHSHAYQWINLPPYQFAQTSHWLEYKPGGPILDKPAAAAESLDTELVRLLPGQPDKGAALFEINPNHELYQLGTKGHEVVEQTLVPASMYNEFVLSAARILIDATELFVPQLSNLTMSSPLVVNPIGRVLLSLVERELQPGSWDFTLYTRDEQNKNGSQVTHGTGRVTALNSQPVSITSFQSLSSMILARCKDIESSPASIGFKGPTTYRAMRLVVTYLDYYHGIQSIWSIGNEAMARICLPPARPKDMGTGFCDHVLVDSFTQISGVLANVFARHEDDQMWVCNYINEINFTPRFVETGRSDQTWIAYSKYELPTPKKLQCDIFVFEPESGQLVLTITAISFQKLSVKSLTKTLGRLNSTNNKTSRQDAPAQEVSDCIETSLSTQNITQTAVSRQSASHGNPSASSRTVVTQTTVQREVQKATTAVTSINSGSLYKVKRMLSDIIEIPTDEIEPESTLETLGVDSLLVTEIFAEVNQRFNISLSHKDFATVTDVQGLAMLVGGSNDSSPDSSTGSTQSGRAAQHEVSASMPSAISTPCTGSSWSGIDMETVVFAERSGTPLSADIYYPNALGDGQKSLPIALMIHGGGHTMSTRKDIRNDQTQMLLKNGFLPVSIDYRLCPEVTIIDGPIRDVRDALCWARKTLPTLTLGRPDIRADGDKVVAVGWSSGGHLAMSLAWTAPPVGVRPPDAVLSFYCPTDYEDSFWRLPNHPFSQKPIPPPDNTYNHLYDGLYDKPVVGYSPDPTMRALGGWASLDDPRSRIVLHMNWEGKALPVLINGLSRISDSTSKRVSTPSMPSAEQIQSISPLAHIRAGRYNVPTFLIHGTRDDHVPWQQSQRTYEALREQGIPAEVVVLPGALHLFDMFQNFKRNEVAVKAVNDGYAFLSAHV